MVYISILILFLFQTLFFKDNASVNSKGVDATEKKHSRHLRKNLEKEIL